MMGHLRACLRHGRVRLLAILRSPASLLVLLGFGVMTYGIAPGMSGPSGSGWASVLPPAPQGSNLYVVYIVCLWLMIWPVLPSIYAAGRVGGRSGSDTLGQRAAPGLPVGPAMRSLAEVVLVIAFLMLARLPILIYLPPENWIPYLQMTLAAALLLLPTLTAWATPSSDDRVFWLKPTVMMVLVAIAMQEGLLASLWSLAATCIVLAAIPLALASRDIRLPSPRGKDLGPESRSRGAAPPEARYRRDVWAEPVYRYRWILVCCAVVLLAYLVVDQLVSLHAIVTLLVFDVVFIAIIATAAFRPAGGNLLPLSLKGGKGYSRGDYLRAWSVLPLGRPTILRNVYRFGFLTAGLMWLALVSLAAFRVYLHTGVFRLTGGRGDFLEWIILPTVVLVPCWAAFLTGTAAGRFPVMVVTGITFLFILHVHPILSFRFPHIDVAVAAILTLLSHLVLVRQLGPDWAPPARGRPAPTAGPSLAEKGLAS